MPHKSTTKQMFVTPAVHVLRACIVRTLYLRGPTPVGALQEIAHMHGVPGATDAAVDDAVASLCRDGAVRLAGESLSSGRSFGLHPAFEFGELPAHMECTPALRRALSRPKKALG